MTAANGGLARLFGAALAGLYGPAVLHRVTRTRLRGGSTVESVVDVPCRAQIEAADARFARAAGATATAVRIRVLAAGLSGPVTTDDRITIAGQRYAVAAVGRDPAGAGFELEGRRG
jgi:hypothetical protein